MKRLSIALFLLLPAALCAADAAAVRRAKEQLNLFKPEAARRVLADTIAVMREKIVPFAPGMSFEEMMQAVSRMTLRELLCERRIETDRLDELDAALRKIPNI